MEEQMYRANALAHHGVEVRKAVAEAVLEGRGEHAGLLEEDLEALEPDVEVVERDGHVQGLVDGGDALEQLE